MDPSLLVVNVGDELVALKLGLGQGLSTQLSKVHLGPGGEVRHKVELEPGCQGAL